MWLWLVVALLAAVGEVMTTGLFLAIVALAAVLTAIVSLVLPFALVQVALFAGMSLGGIAFIRPVLLRSFGIDALSHSSGRVTQSQIVGRRATVTRTVDSAGGQVRIGDGEFWSARSYDPDDLIPVGASAEIVVVDGLTALVSPVVPITLEDDSQFTLQDDTQLTSKKGA
jgi:membrane protein implicated in regulation of membrane protease activity